MTEFTIDDLKRVLRTSAGPGDGDPVDDLHDHLDTDFAALGYDSLAVLSIQSRIENTYDLTLPDDAHGLMKTPRDTIAVVNSALAQAAQGEACEHARTDNSIVINAPFELIWKMTNDVENWPSLYSEFAKAQILERDGDTIRFRLTMHPDENGIAWSWVSERTTDLATRTVRSRRVETGPFEFMNLFWEFTDAEGGGVRMRWVQEFHTKPDAPADDAAFVQHINTNSKIQMGLIRDRIEARAAQAAVTEAR